MTERSPTPEQSEYPSRTSSGSTTASAPADTTATGETGEPDGLPKDVVFGLLSAERRRDVLRYLAATGEETTLSDLADHIAAKENGIDPQLLSSKQRKRVYVALYQSHLPKMDDANVVDFDHSRGSVELRTEADELFSYLALDPSPRNETRRESRVFDTVHALRARLGTWIGGDTVLDRRRR